MEVGGILSQGAINGSKQWQLGERLLVEVIQKTGENEGMIRAKGKDVLAILDTSVELGEKFWVKVRDLKNGNVLLVREPLMEKQVDLHVVPQQFQQLIERGLPINKDIINLLKAFLTGETGNTGNTSSLLGNKQGTSIDEVMLNLRNSIPEWNSLSEENGAGKIVECLRKLGLNYEQRIQQMLKLDSPDKETEKNAIKDTLKYKLLEAIGKQEGQDSKGNLTSLLQKITGQQLWFKTGALDSAFMLLHLPLLNQGQLVPTQIAIESARKGTKMDEQHCRVAIQIETQQLGDIGIDAFFDQDSLTFCILTRNLPFLSQLLEEVMPETRAEFSKLGFTIAKVETGDLDQNIEFQNFLRGIRRSGVDVQR